MLCGQVLLVFVGYVVKFMEIGGWGVENLENFSNFVGNMRSGRMSFPARTKPFFTMKLKYQENLESIGRNCPPDGYVAEQITPVYRWVFEQIEDPRNFQAPLFRKPTRFSESSPHRCCEAMALSMFDNLEGARARFLELKTAMGESIYKALGNRIAIGYIEKSDGLHGGRGRHGHFNFHPAETMNFHEKFQISTEAL
jgi:hypothetical protein